MNPKTRLGVLDLWLRRSAKAQCVAHERRKRKTFIKKRVVFPVGVVVLGVAWILQAWLAPRIEIRQFKEWAKGNYGVTMIDNAQRFGKMNSGPIRWQNAKVSDVARYTRFLKRELGLYPRGLVDSAGMMQIVITGELKVNGNDVGGASWFGSILIRSSENSRGWECHYLARILHHEFFHLLDTHREEVPSEDLWSSWNPPDTKYGEGGLATHLRANRIDVFGHSPDLEGFVTLYAQSSIREDKAEVFSYMMTEPALLRERMATDEYVNTKVTALMSSLHLLVPEMDEDYWSGILEMRETQVGWGGC